jgi:superfamily II DNA helicase RecQ
MLTSSFNRRNLYYEVRPKRPKFIVSDIADFIKSQHAGQTGIIYCLSRIKCEEVAKELRDTYGLKARHFHAGMSAIEKEIHMSAWQDGTVEIIVATVSATVSQGFGGY